MAQHGRERFEKRQRERAKQQRAAAKRDRREERRVAGESGDAPDEAALMEQFRTLNERYADGAVDTEQFEAERHDILVALGLEQPLEG